MGIPEYEAKRYEGMVKEGGILLSVHSDHSAWTKRAKEILERTSAKDISSTGEAITAFCQDRQTEPACYRSDTPCRAFSPLEPNSGMP